MTTDAMQIEQALDLKRQLNVLDQITSSDMIFQDTSPPARWDTVYSTQTGEPIRVKRHRLIATLEKRLPDGSKAFTADKAAAPEYKLGVIKCFLARGSEQREKVDAYNISPGFYCNAEHLANPMAMIVHAQNKHPTRWKQYQAMLEREERDEDRARQDAQIAAILQLAQSKADGDETPRRGPGRPPREV